MGGGNRIVAVGVGIFVGTRGGSFFGFKTSLAFEAPRPILRPIPILPVGVTGGIGPTTKLLTPPEGGAWITGKQ